MSYSIAHTIPEEDHENYITEEEAINMIKGFNFHLKNLSIQSDELKKQNSNLLFKLSKEKERNESFRASIVDSRKTLQELEEQTQSSCAFLSQLEQKIANEESKVLSSGLIDLESYESEDMSEKGMNYLEELLNYYEKLETYSIILTTQDDLLRKKINDKRNQLYSELKCVNCRERYVPARNSDKACAYHPGKLRYFSCRGCGADAYYDCCIRCKDCSKGCKVSHHTS
jgi:vacuolar-type H+-ATPase subunit I/STV1